MTDVNFVFSKLLEYFSVILSNFFNFIFDEFYVFPPDYGITLGYLLLAYFVFVIIFKFLVAVPQTGGGGKRAKSSKKGSKSSSSDTSDS